jgi:hypothetical protein
MPMWRDPLDELIEELELTVPPRPESTRGLMPLEEVIAFADTILYGSEDAKRRLLENPEVLRRLRSFAPNADRNFKPTVPERVYQAPGRTDVPALQHDGSDKTNVGTRNGV